MKHTPDEWYVEEDSAGRPGVRNRSGFVSFSPSVIHYTGQSERYKAELDERLARAQLIAASPDLLEALNVCRSVLKANFANAETVEGRRAMGALNAAIAAIAKATGGAP